MNSAGEAALAAYTAALEPFSPAVVEKAAAEIIAEAGEYPPSAGQMHQRCVEVQRRVAELVALPPPRRAGPELWSDRVIRLEIPATTLTRIGIVNLKPLMDCHHALPDEDVREAVAALAAGRAWQPAPRTMRESEAGS